MTKRALIGSHYLPQPDLDSSSRRHHHLLRFLVDDGWEVIVAARNGTPMERWERSLRQAGVTLCGYDKTSLESVLGGATVDLAILGFWQVAERLINLIRRVSPRTRIIVDSMDLHFVRHARATFASPDPNAVMLEEQWGSDTIRELNVYAAADLVLTVSGKEADVVGDLTGDPTLAVAVPDCEDIQVSPYGFDDRRGILFVGNFEHPPNADAVRYLAREIVPLVDPSLLAEHHVSVVGSGFTPELRESCRGASGLRTVGWVPTVVPYFERARLAVAPLRYGAGTKRKMIQALMAGTPAVSTSIGVEGLEIQHGEHVLVADAPSTFAAAIELLLRDRAVWERVAHGGRARMSELRGLAAGKRRFLAAIAQALEREPGRRLLPGGAASQGPRSMTPEEYRRACREMRRAVENRVPPGSTVAVVSNGDPDVLEFTGSVGWHFPRDNEGQYTWFHPKDSDEAIERLETVRSSGAEFLVFPRTTLWWLDHYEQLAHHLGERFACVISDATCAIFDLRLAAVATGHSQSPAPAPTGFGSAPARSRRYPVWRHGPDVSVVLPTFNRASYLERSLESLTGQTLLASAFEVVVVDDGSTDGTRAICERFSDQVSLRYCPIERSGIAAAKNAGVASARGWLLVFFDDDDVADSGLLRTHVDAHRDHPDEEVAVLGFTGWAPSLEVTPVMRFVTDVGHYLFSYDKLANRQVLDFTYFWGGRSSCKRTLLARRGIFRPEFRFGSEDIELGYRLSKFGFKVVYRPDAVQHMIRPVTFDEFCRRCERQGRSQWAFSQMHDDPVVEEWCGIRGAFRKWQALEGELPARVARVRDLEADVASRKAGSEAPLRDLWAQYWWTFDAFKVKGIVEGMAESRRAQMFVNA